LQNLQEIGPDCQILIRQTLHGSWDCV
jgi:hypothetical protein